MFRKATYGVSFVMIVLLSIWLAACGLFGEDEDVHDVKLYYDFIGSLFAQHGINLKVTEVEHIEDGDVADLLDNSQVLYRNETFGIESAYIKDLSVSAQSNLKDLIVSLIAGINTETYKVSWSFGSKSYISYGIFRSSDNTIIFDPIPSLLITARHSIGDDDSERPSSAASPAPRQPTNKGDRYNTWGENIYGMDLYAIAISWGTAYCDEEGCIAVPDDPNIWIQVEIETKFFWTADAVVTSYQVSPDCKSVTFQVNIVAAGPLAKLDIKYDKKGLKVGASVSGPIGTYRKTLNSTWKCL